MLDRYTWGNADRLSQEAPVAVLRTNRCEERLGGAANVCHMVHALQSRVTCAGVVGADRAGHHLTALLFEAGIDCGLILVDPARPTTLKERFVGLAGTRHPSQMLRVDTETEAPIPAGLETQLKAAIQSRITDYDAVLISDYNKGVLTPALTAAIIQAARAAGRPVLVDPGRGRNFAIYRGATLLKPNRVEAAMATGRSVEQPQDAISAGRQLCRQHDLDMTIVTLDSDGMALIGRDGVGEIIPTEARSVYDITGAGDIVLSVLGLCLGGGTSPEAAVRLANAAAGLEVQKNGVAVISREELEGELVKFAPATARTQSTRKLVTCQQAAELAEQFRRENRRVVFTNGCFDLLHVGHVTYLQQAASLGDRLIVGVNSDHSVRRLKGLERPIINERDRAAMLAAMACVDHVVVFEQDTPHALLRAIRPDVLVKGGTYSPEEVVGHEIVSGYGGQVQVTGVVDGVSTTQIVQSLSQSLQDAA